MDVPLLKKYFLLSSSIISFCFLWGLKTISCRDRNFNSSFKLSLFACYPLHYHVSSEPTSELLFLVWFHFICVLSINLTCFSIQENFIRPGTWVSWMVQWIIRQYLKLEAEIPDNIYFFKYYHKIALTLAFIFNSQVFFRLYMRVTKSKSCL